MKAKKQEEQDAEATRDKLTREQVGAAMGDVLVKATSLCVALVADRQRITHIEALRQLGFIEPGHEEEEQALNLFDMTLAADGEDYVRAWLARHEPTREVCRKYRPATWERLKPTDAEIKRETAKWKRECEAADRAKRQAEKTAEAGR